MALAALMRIPPERVAWLGAEALRRLQAAPLSDQQRFLLGDCVQAYLPLDEQQQREFERLLATESYQGVQAMNITPYEKGFAAGQQAMNTTWYEKGIEEGIEKGIAKERRDFLRELLEERFGPLPPEVLARLNELPPERLQPLRKAALKAQNLAELGLSD